MSHTTITKKYISTWFNCDIYHIVLSHKVPIANCVNVNSSQRSDHNILRGFVGKCWMDLHNIIAQKWMKIYGILKQNSESLNNRPSAFIHFPLTNIYLYLWVILPNPEWNPTFLKHRFSLLLSSHTHAAFLSLSLSLVLLPFFFLFIRFKYGIFISIVWIALPLHNGY